MIGAILITSYHSLKDPIVEGLLLRYLQHINRDQVNHYFILVTFEQPQYALPLDERLQLIKNLKKKGIIWKPLTYRTGGPFMIFKKIINFLSVWLYAFWIQGEYRILSVMGFTSISGGMAAILGKLFRKPIIIYCFEPHSEYQVDFDIWSPDSISYRVLRRLEKFQVKHAKHVVVPTRYGVDLVSSWGTKATIYTMPVSVDEQLFTINDPARKEIRDKLDVAEKKVILYLGKFGGIYFPVETLASFYSSLSKQSEDYHFLTITTSLIDEVNTKLMAAGLGKSTFTTLPPVPYSEVNQYINASDLGILAVPSLPSQKYRTPIKTANYLLCGLPYLVNPGVAEDDLIAQDEGVGIVANIENLSSSAAIHKEVFGLLDNNDLRKHCRDVGLHYRKLSNTTQLLDSIFKSVI